MSLQTSNGAVFDAIVFGEQQPQRWMAGSEFFRRTQSFGGASEDAAEQKLVTVALVYSADGTVTAYRNGEIYGSSYRKSELVEFTADNAVITFGLRHLPASDGRMLSGIIYSAALFDHALSPGQIAAVMRREAALISSADVLAALSEKQKQNLEELRGAIAGREVQIAALSSVAESPVDVAVWTELARAMFTFKEFIYVR